MRCLLPPGFGCGAVSLCLRPTFPALLSTQHRVCFAQAFVPDGSLCKAYGIFRSPEPCSLSTYLHLGIQHRAGSVSGARFSNCILSIKVSYGAQHKFFSQPPGATRLGYGSCGVLLETFSLASLEVSFPRSRGLFTPSITAVDDFRLKHAGATVDVELLERHIRVEDLRVPQQE